jgi:hypothetical protein
VGGAVVPSAITNPQSTKTLDYVCAAKLCSVAAQTLLYMNMPGKFWECAMGRIVLGLVLSSTIAMVNARDLGQWENTDPAIKQWYQALMQPDVPTASCCGEADAYYADEVHVRNGKTYAVITDDRPDEPRRRPHIDVGTEIEIPNNKLKWDKSNPTGHGIVFLSRAGYVYCYVQPGGV